MIAPWIIEQSKQEEEKYIDNRPRLELPLYEEKPCNSAENKVESKRGVIVINLGEDDESEEE